MSWVAAFLAFAGFCALIVFHELGHFTAAKAVGMRVERFALFFPPLVWKKKIGETEYGIGAIPLGGYVKISGMSPAEDLPDEVRDRAYHAQPVWKRIVVIAAGPAVNLVIALPAAAPLLRRLRPARRGREQGRRGREELSRAQRPASRATRSSRSTARRAASTRDQQARSPRTRCADNAKVKGCKATTPATIVDPARRQAA